MMDIENKKLELGEVERAEKKRRWVVEVGRRYAWAVTPLPREVGEVGRRKHTRCKSGGAWVLPRQ